MKYKILHSLTVGIILGTTLSQFALAATDQGGPITKAELTTPIKSFPTDLVTGANETQFSNYAWRLFIAAMQKTTASLHSGAGRAVGNGINNFIDTGKSPAVTNPLVFESFYHRTEAFPHYTVGNKPKSPINQLPVYYPSNQDLTTPITGQNYVFLDETNQISQNFLYYKNSHSPDFPVLFMAKVNTAEAAYALGKTSGPSATSSWDFPDGVIEVKTAWRRVSDIKNSDPRKYHQASGTYYVTDASGTTAHTDTFALIAIHIIQKTTNYQHFIFTTFEHVDAVTRNSKNIITDPFYKTEYNYVSYKIPNKEPHTATALGAYSINEQGQPSGNKNKLTTYTLPAAGPVKSKPGNGEPNVANVIPAVVTQPNTIIKEVNDVNNQVNKLVQSIDPTNIWANYRLKGVQAVPTSDSDTSNYYLANIVVESSQPGIQLFSGVLLYGGVPLQGVTSPKYTYFVNCRGNVGSSKCMYTDKKLNKLYPTDQYNGAPFPNTYKNVSPSATDGGKVAPPTHSMGGCQGCHGAAQQGGRDFSFLAGAPGAGKELDSVPSSALSPKQRAAHNLKMINSSNSR